MSNSLLYHAFGVRGYSHQRIDFTEGCVIFTIRQPRENLRCSACGRRNVVCRGTGEPREFRTLPIGGKPTFIRFAIPCLQQGV